MVPTTDIAIRRDERGRTWLGVLQRIMRVLRTEGIKGFAYKALGKAFYRHVVLFELDLERFDADPRARVPIEVRRLEERDLAGYAALHPNESGNEARRRLGEGHICYAAWQGDRIVSSSWFQSGRAWIPEVARWVELRDRQVYGSGSYTSPELRGRNIAPERTAHSYRSLREEGHRSVVVYVLPENRANFRVLAKLGFERVGVAGLFRLGPIRLRFTRQSGERTRWSLRSPSLPAPHPPPASSSRL